jgi:NAD(P)H-hydrate epimerase
MSELVLMEHAALSLVRALENRFGDLLSQVQGMVLAGPGNNGGDVLAAARILFLNDIHRFKIAFLPSKKPSPSCENQVQVLKKLGVDISSYLEESELEKCSWVLDGLVGTGLSKPVEGDLLKWIELVNKNKTKWVVAADIPSGLCADTGMPLPHAIRASQTVSFGFIKKGMVTGQGPLYCGKILLDTVQIPRECLSSPTHFLIEKKDILLPFRNATSHKGNFGHVWVVAGEKRGASILSALGALRVGAGLSTVIAPLSELGNFDKGIIPEIMLAAEESFSQTQGILIVGPGLGEDSRAKQRVEKAVDFSGTLIVDADAINLISKGDSLINKIKNRKPGSTVLTPHPKEAARLCGKTVEEVEKDRYSAIKEIVERTACTVILKGKGTLISSPENKIYISLSGDSGLSKGGTGDLLAGIVAGLVAQGEAALSACYKGAFIHGLSSERITQRVGHTYSTLASEIANELPLVIAEL